MIIQDYKKFLDRFLLKISQKGIDVSGLEMDHVGYQTLSEDDYKNTKVEFDKIGKLVKEDIVNGRSVGIFKLFRPLIYKNYKFEAVEVYAPKKDQIVKRGLEHAEIVIKEDFQTMMEKYPGLEWDTSAVNSTSYAQLKLRLDEDIQVKFHHAPILDIVMKK